MIFKRILPKIFFKRRLPQLAPTQKDEVFKIFKHSVHGNFKKLISINEDNEGVLSNHLDTLITNYIMHVQRQELSEEKKKEYIEFFIYSFLSDFFRESELSTAVSRITKQLEFYEVSSKI